MLVGDPYLDQNPWISFGPHQNGRFGVISTLSSLGFEVVQLVKFYVQLLKMSLN